jgi:predicted  nucleic acid-binding Zn-ribbon protein
LPLHCRERENSHRHCGGIFKSGRTNLLLKAFICCSNAFTFYFSKNSQEGDPLKRNENDKLALEAKRLAKAAAAAGDPSSSQQNNGKKKAKP